MLSQPTRPPPADDGDRRERRRIARGKAIRLGAALVALVAIPPVVYLLLGTPLFSTALGIPQPAPSPLTLLRIPLAGGVVVALLLLTWAYALLTVLLDVPRLVQGRRQARGLVCPNCRRREAPPTVAFARKAIPGTGWEELACPYCRKVWHRRL